jgi:hypothetical protein
MGGRAGRAIMRAIVIRAPGPLGSGLRGRSSVGRALASQAKGRGFDPRRPLHELARHVGTECALKRGLVVAGAGRTRMVEANPATDAETTAPMPNSVSQQRRGPSDSVAPGSNGGPCPTKLPARKLVNY